MEGIDPLRNIIQVFRDEKYDYSSLYRYVTLSEFTALFDKKQLSFTNPKAWTSTDPKETYFEQWWTHTDNLNILFEKVSDQIKAYNKFNIQTNSIVEINYLIVLQLCAAMQHNAYCYCLSKNWNNPKMIEEYHNQFKRDVVLCYKKDFYKRMALLPNCQLALNIDCLYADLFPMYYIDSFQEYIGNVFTDLTDRGLLISRILNTGRFLKDKTYDYENEIRFKLAFHYNDISEALALPVLRQHMIGKRIDSKDKIIKFSMELTDKIRTMYEYKENQLENVILNNKFQLTLNCCKLADLIDYVIISRKIEPDDYKRVMQFCHAEHIRVKLIDFNIY